MCGGGGVTSTDAAWAALIAGGLALEGWAVRHSTPTHDAGTLSHLTRRIFRPHTPAGALALGVALGWTAGHLAGDTGQRSRG